MSQPVRTAPKRTRLTRDDRRSMILDMAGTIVLSEGKKAATVERVARSMNVSKGLLYQHFESRELMLAAIVEREIDVLIDKGAFAALRDGESFDAGLRAALRLLFDYIDERGPLLQIVVSEREVVAELSGRARTIWAQVNGSVRDLILKAYRLPPAILGDAVELTIAIAAQSARKVAERAARPALAEDLAVNMISGGLRSLETQYA